MTPLAVLLLAAGTYAFRACGPVLHRRRGAVLAGAAGAVGVRDRAAVRAGRDLGTHRRSRLRRLVPARGGAGRRRAGGPAGAGPGGRGGGPGPPRGAPAGWAGAAPPPPPGDVGGRAPL